MSGFISILYFITHGYDYVIEWFCGLEDRDSLTIHPSDTNEKVAVKVPSGIHLLTPYGFLLASASVWLPYGSIFFKIPYLTAIYALFDKTKSKEYFSFLKKFSDCVRKTNQNLYSSNYFEYNFNLTFKLSYQIPLSHRSQNRNNTFQSHDKKKEPNKKKINSKNTSNS